MRKLSSAGRRFFPVVSLTLLALLVTTGCQRPLQIATKQESKTQGYMGFGEIGIELGGVSCNDNGSPGLAG